MWTWLFVGIAMGLGLAVPTAGVWARRVERRALASERRAQKAERLAELGTMTGGLAHEIKNPLSTVGLNVQLLQEDLAEAQKQLNQLESASDEQPRRNASHVVDELRDNLGRIARRLDGLHRETQRLRDILEDFLRFAGRFQLHREPTDLHELLRELSDFFEPQASDAGVRLRLDLPADPHTADVDAALLKQAILNLMLNAVQAMQAARAADPPKPHGGCDELHLRTSNNAPADNRNATPRIRMRGSEPLRDDDRGALCIHVTDTGPGIPADVLPRIFEPYFSSGKKGGSGLGLPTTRRIIEEHDGQLTVHSDEGRGTAFTVTLPA